MADVKDFKLPDLGEGLEEGDIVAWRVEVGEVIELNQTVADIETAKAVVEVPSPFAGTVVETIGEVGQSLEVGAVFVRIDVAGGEVAGGDAAAPVAEGEASPAQGGFEADAEAQVPDPDAEPDAAVVGEGQPPVASSSGRASSGLDADEEPQPLVGYGQGKSGVTRRPRRRGGGAAGGNGQAAAAAEQTANPLAKPPVRKPAKDLGGELAAIAPGSGAGGVITRDDVQAAASPAPDRAPAAAGDGQAAPDVPCPLPPAAPPPRRRERRVTPDFPWP